MRQGGKGRSAFVYIVQRSDGLVKIGLTDTPKKRFASLSAASGSYLRVLAVVRGSGFDEGRLHTRFAALRVKGEWFSPSDELIQCAKDLRAGGTIAEFLSAHSEEHSLAAFRVAAGLTQGDLGRQVGNAFQVTVSRWERGLARPREARIPDLARALNRTVAEVDAVLRPRLRRVS